MKILLVLALACSTLCHAAPPPDTLLLKAPGGKFAISAEEMKLGRHIDMKLGRSVGADSFTGDVRAAIGNAFLLCNRATLEDEGYVFLAPTIQLNGATLTAAQMVYNSTQHKAVLTNVLEYKDGTHYHEYCVIDFCRAGISR